MTYVITGWSGVLLRCWWWGRDFCRIHGGARDQLPLARDRVLGMILSMAEDSLICPGHGPVTTVGQERTHNPWFP